MNTLGIDISKEWFDVCLLHGTQRAATRFDNDLAGFAALRNWLVQQLDGAPPTQLHVAMEATGRYGEALATALVEWGYPVSIVNPARIKAYAASMGQQHKSDRTDAYVIADFCRRRTPRLWQPPTASHATLRAMVRHLDALQRMHSQERNRRQAGPLPSQVEQLIDAHLSFIQQQLAELQRQMAAWVDDDPDLKQQHDLLCSIVGIGTLTATKLLGELPPIALFADARALAAFAGSIPRQQGSGKRTWPGRLSKAGRSEIRQLLFFPALSARHHNPILRDFADRLAAKGKAPMQVIAAVMRKLLHLVYGVLKHQQPFDPDYLTRPARA